MKLNHSENIQYIGLLSILHMMLQSNEALKYLNELILFSFEG